MFVIHVSVILFVRTDENLVYITNFELRQHITIIQEYYKYKKCKTMLKHFSYLEQYRLNVFVFYYSAEF